MRRLTPPAPIRTKPLARLHAACRGFMRATGGATAVEFALVGIPFIALLFGILELALLFMVSTSLDNATAQAGRTIRTGQLQMAGSATAATFKTTICNGLGWLASSCSTDLNVDVRTYAKFADIALTNPIVNKNFDGTAMTFTPGCPGDIVVVRAYYQWTLLAPMLTGAVQSLNGGKTLMTSTLAFRNEPYATSC